MKKIRILFTGIGRRVELVQAFREAALELNIDLKVYGADVTGTAPALAYCDHIRKICSMKDSNYISELVDICEKDQIDLLIPTIDTDLLVISENVSLFGDTKVLISAFDKIAICRDKNKTADFFESCGCKTPNTINDWQDFSGHFPCFIKPKDGSSSIDAFKVENIESLEIYAKQIKEYVIQSFVEGTEYTVDIFCDFYGNPIYISPRVRLQVRAGEVLKTQISTDEKIIEECKQIVKAFKPVGPMTIQLIRDKETGEDFFIEINPRFGGGAPLSMKAGANSAKTLLQILIGENIDEIDSVRDGEIYSRFDQSVCINKTTIGKPIKGIIFDLDDTLYDEKQYIKSGFKAVSEYLKVDDAADKMWAYYNAGEQAIDKYLYEIAQLEKKTECLMVYRNHMPNITLSNNVGNLLVSLKEKGFKIGIITDGRPNGQHNKISALELDQIVDDVIVTDELGGEQFRKPCDIAFRIMQKRWRIPFEQIIYLGDNVDKDFQAPKQLGMQYMLINNGNGIYATSKDGETISKAIEKVKFWHEARK